MRICAAQFSPVAGDIEKNIESHLQLIEQAIDKSADLIFFSELSLIGYEPTIANSLAFSRDDSRLSIFQKKSDSNNIIVGVGLPLKFEKKCLIGLAFFRPYKEIIFYSKQVLHEDEYSFFSEGNEQLLIRANNEILAPAICYESMKDSHSGVAKKQGATVYLCSVAKHIEGIERGEKHYSKISKAHGMVTVMANCFGKCDSFIAHGSSAIWDQSGHQKAMLGNSQVGIVGFDTALGKTFR